MESTLARIRFAVPEPDVAGMLRSPLLQGSPRRHGTLVDTYFDSAEFALLAAGSTLRVRRRGARPAQIVDTPAGFLGWVDRIRREERPLRRGGPDPIGTASAGIVPAGSPLDAVFTVQAETCGAGVTM